MNIFYEESGQFKVAAVIQKNDSTYQADTRHGKRTKVKAANVFAEFDGDMAAFLEKAQNEIPTTDLAKHILNISGGFSSWGNLLKGAFSKDKTNNNTQTFVNTLKANSQQFLKELRYEVDVEGFGQLYTFNKNII